MGTRGPKKKSEAVKRATGDLRKQKKDRSKKSSAKKKPAKKKPAAKPAEIPAAPRWFSKAAREEWYRIKPHLVKMNVFSSAYRAAIVAYCSKWGEYVEAEQFLRSQGQSTYVIRDKDGKIKTVAAFPQVRVSQNALADAIRYAKELGLTPSTAGHLDADLPEKAPLEDDDSHWFDKYKKAN